MQVLRSETEEALQGPLEAVQPLVAPTELPAFPMVVVEWQDAWFDPDQSDDDGFRTDYLVRTMGFLIDEGPQVITVAHEVLPDGDGFRAVTHIPVPIVRRIHRLWPGTDGSR